jgi:Protein of unknown function (DUF3617)
MKVRALVVFVALLALSLSALAQMHRRDGNWEVKMEMDMPGMPANMPAMTTTQCVTPEEASDPQKAMPPQGRGGRGNQDCKISDYKVDGNKVSWSMKCEGKQPMSGTGEFVYAADAYTGLMKMDMGGRGMTMKYSGKRLGDCTK